MNEDPADETAHEVRLSTSLKPDEGEGAGDEVVGELIATLAVTTDANAIAFASVVGDGARKKMDSGEGDRETPGGGDLSTAGAAMKRKPASGS